MSRRTVPLLLAMLMGCLPLEPTRPNPAITAIDPVEAAPDQVVTLQGTAFDPSQGDSMVTFGEVAAGPSAAWTDTTIEVVVPEQEPGPVEVFVTVDGLESNRALFTVAAAPLPVIEAIAPPDVLPGATVTITGTDFGPDRGTAGTVVFHRDIDAGDGITAWSDTAIDVVVPEGAESGPVVVVTDAGESAPSSYAVGGVPSGPTLAQVQEQVFTPHCAVAECHDSQTARSGLVLQAGLAYANLVEVPSRERPAVLRVAPGEPDDSYLYLKISAPIPPEGDRMPQGLLPLSADLIGLVRAWIEAGAPSE